MREGSRKEEGGGRKRVVAHSEQAGEAGMMVGMDVADPHALQGGYHLSSPLPAVPPHQLPKGPLACRNNIEIIIRGCRPRYVLSQTNVYTK